MLIANGKFDELFRDMNKQLNLNSTAGKNLILIQSRHSSRNQNEMKGIVSHGEDQLDSNKISDSLLKLIDGLNAEDIDPNSPAVEDTLDALARQLDVQIPLTPLHLVNCDRKDARKSFRRSFGRWQEAERTFQFYFILACPTQEPEGFSERIIYELLGDHEDNHHQSINYQRREDTGRARIERLPLGMTLKTSQEAFKKYFATRFPLGDATFDEYLRTGLPLLNWEYIATVMSITAQDWDPDLVEDYLQWLMDSFLAVNAHSSSFLFFFVISLKNAHDEAKIRGDDKDILNSVKQLIEKNGEHAVLISALPPVEAEDFEYWLEELGSPPQNQKDAIIQAIVNRIPEEEKKRFNMPDKLLNMEHIEDFQERVYKIHK